MCEPTTIAAAASYLGASAGTASTIGYAGTAAAYAAGAYGMYQQGQVSKQVGRNNAIMAERAAQDAQRRGEQEAIAARRKTDQLRGLQRARMAANGLDINFGTPADILDQTDFFAQSDQATIRNNAKRQAWADRAQGANFTSQGDAAATQANLSAFGTLLGGGGQLADKWYTYNRKAA